MSGQQNIKVLVERPIGEVGGEQSFVNGNDHGNVGNRGKQRYVVRLITTGDTNALSVGISRQWLRIGTAGCTGSSSTSGNNTGNGEGEWLPTKRGGHLFMPIRTWCSLVDNIEEINREVVQQALVVNHGNIVGGQQQQQQQQQRQQQQQHHADGTSDRCDLGRDVRATTVCVGGSSSTGGGGGRSFNGPTIVTNGNTTSGHGGNGGSAGGVSSGDGGRKRGASVSFKEEAAQQQQQRDGDEQEDGGAPAKSGKWQWQPRYQDDRNVSISNSSTAGGSLVNHRS